MTPVVTCDRLASVTSSGRERHRDHAPATTTTPTVQPIALRGNGFGTSRPWVAEIAPEHHVLGQAERHADRRGAEAVVEPDAGLQQAGDQRADEGAEVDAEIEQREAAVGAGVALLVERAEQRRRVGLQRAGAQRDEHQADADAGQAGQDRQRDVAEHDHHAAVEHGAFHAEQPVGDPAAEHRRQVHQPAVGADDAGGGALRQLRARRR